MAGKVGMQGKRSQVHPVDKDCLADENGASFRSAKPKESNPKRQPLQSAENRVVQEDSKIDAETQSCSVQSPSKKQGVSSAEKELNKLTDLRNDIQPEDKGSAALSETCLVSETNVSTAGEATGTKSAEEGKARTRARKKAKEPWREPSTKDAAENHYSRGGLKAATSSEDKRGGEKRKDDETDAHARRSSVKLRWERKLEPARTTSEEAGTEAEGALSERDTVLETQSQEEKAKQTQSLTTVALGSEKQLEGQDEEGWMKVKKKNKRRMELPPWNSVYHAETNSPPASVRKGVLQYSEDRQSTEDRKPVSLSAKQGPKIPAAPGSRGSKGESAYAQMGVARQDTKLNKQGQPPEGSGPILNQVIGAVTRRKEFLASETGAESRDELNGGPKAEQAHSTSLEKSLVKGAGESSSQKGSADKGHRPDISAATPAKVAKVAATNTKGKRESFQSANEASSQKGSVERKAVSEQAKEGLKAPDTVQANGALSAAGPKEEVSKKAEEQSAPKTAPTVFKPSGSKSKLSVSAVPFIPRSLQTAALSTTRPAAKPGRQSTSGPVQPRQGSSVDAEGALKKDKDTAVSATLPKAAPPRVVVTPVKKAKPTVGKTAVNGSGSSSQPPQNGSSQADATAGAPTIASPQESGKPANESDHARSNRRQSETRTSRVKDLVVGTIRVPHLETVSAGVMPGRVSLVVKSGHVSSRDAALSATGGGRCKASTKEMETAAQGVKADEKRAEERVAHEGSQARSGRSVVPKSGNLEAATSGNKNDLTNGAPSDGDTPPAMEAPSEAASASPNASATFGSHAAASEQPRSTQPDSADKKDAIEAQPVDPGSSPELLATESGKSGRKSKPKRLSLVARQQALKKEDQQQKSKIPLQEPKAAGEHEGPGLDGKRDSGEASRKDTEMSSIEESGKSEANDLATAALTSALGDSTNKAAVQKLSGIESTDERAIQSGRKAAEESKKESSNDWSSGSNEKSERNEKERKGGAENSGREGGDEKKEGTEDRKVTASSDEAVNLEDEQKEVAQSRDVEKATEPVKEEKMSVEARRKKRASAVDNELKEVLSSLEEGGGSIDMDRSIFRQRLWSYLFENLGRSIDELYFLCELECDEPQMAETMSVLSDAVDDFRELKERVEKQDRFERERKATRDLPVVHRRNRAIAWEVRRTTSTTERAELLAASLDALRVLRTSSVSQPAARKPSLPRTPPGKTGSISQAGSMRLAALALETGRSSSAPGKFARGKASRRSSDEAAKKGSEAKSSSEDGSNAEVKEAPKNQKPKETSAAGVEEGGQELKASTGNTEENMIGKKRAVSKKALERKASVPGKREPLTEETSNKLVESDRVSDPGSDRASVHSLSRFSDVGSDPNDVSSKYGLAASLSRVAAWREKRNWVDHLATVPSPKRTEAKRSLEGESLPRGLLTSEKRAGSAERAKMLHDRLMSPERRKKTPSETREKVDEKQARAAQVRIDLESERRAKMQRSAERASKVTEWQEIRRSKLSKSMEVRHQQSESRYEAHLAQIVKRAGDEATKVNEIQFINTMTAENKKLSTQQKMQDSEARRQELLKLQVKKREEEAAKEEAAQERRKQKEEERQRKLSEAQRKKEEAAARQEEEKRKLMQERKERALQQAQRLEEQKRAQQEQTELLGQRLAERLKESSARRLLYLEQIKERAAVDPERLRLGADSPYGRLSPNRHSPSRNSPLRRPNSREGFRSGGRSAERNLITEKQAEIPKPSESKVPEEIKTEEKSDVTEPVAPVEVPASQDRPAKPLEKPTIVIPSDRVSSAPVTAVTNSAAKEALKKRVKRIRQRLVQKKHEWIESESGTEKVSGSAQGKSRAAKWLLDMQRQQAKGGNGVALESAAGELVKFFEGRPEELNAARRAGLIDFAASALVSTTPVPPPRAVAALLRVLRVLLTWSGNRSYFIARNFLPPLLPILTASLSRFSGAVLPGESNPPRASTPNQEKHLAVEKEGLDAAILEGALSVAALAVKHKCEGDEKVLAMQEDLVELIVVSEIPQKLRDLFSIFDCPPSEGQLGPIPGVYVAGLLLLEGLTSARGKLAGASELPVHQAKAELATNRAAKAVLDAVVETGLVGLPSLLTAVLLRAAPPKTTPEQAAAVLPANFEEVATLVLRVLNNLARLDLKLFQAQLEFSDLKVEFFHLVTFLLSHCTCKWKQANDKVAGLLHETLLLVGYFALLHPGNQAVLRWGKSPTILQKLCELPFPYFSDASLQPLLFGTLLSACYGSDRNRDVVERELSADMLLGFLQTSAAEMPKDMLEAAVNAKSDQVKEQPSTSKLSEVQKSAQGEKGESLSSAKTKLVEDDSLFAQGSEGEMQVTMTTAESGLELEEGKMEDAARDQALVTAVEICEANNKPSNAATKGEAGSKKRAKAGSEAGTKPERKDHSKQKALGLEQTRGPQDEINVEKASGATSVEKSAVRLPEPKRDSQSRPSSANLKAAGRTRGEKKQVAGVGKNPNAVEAKKPGQEVPPPFRLQNRFPLSLWTAAEEYFAKPPAQH